MKVFEQPNPVTREHGGTTSFFCGAGCAAKFDADPGCFLANPGSAPMKAPMTPMMPTSSAANPAPAGKLLGLDPVCGMKVIEKPTVIAREHAGTTYFFCGPRCAERFDADPAAILAAPGTHGMHKAHAPMPAAHAPGPASTGYVCPMDPEVHKSAPGACPVCGMALEPASPLAASRTEYVCPMHPEIVRPAPGECPICGMALEPRTVAVEEGPNPEFLDMRRRFWVSAALTAPLLAIAMAGMLPALRQASRRRGSSGFSSRSRRRWCCGRAPFFARGWRSVVTWRLNMFTLIAIGTGVAYAYSVVATVAPGIFPASFRLTATSRSTSRPPP